MFYESINAAESSGYLMVVLVGMIWFWYFLSKRNFTLQKEVFQRFLQVLPGQILHLGFEILKVKRMGLLKAL